MVWEKFHLMEERQMKRMLVVGLVLAVACTAMAGGNPNVKGYISFDAAGALMHDITPTPFVAFDAYVCFTDVEMGLTTVSFMLSDPTVTCPGAFAPPSFTNLLPGNLAIGAWNTGVTLASTDCMTGPTVVVGKLNLFPLGAGCCLELLDHPDYPRWVVDCNDPGLVDYYCVIAHGNIGGVGCPEGDCGASPVEDTTWGGIKALYR